MSRTAEGNPEQKRRGRPPMPDRQKREDRDETRVEKGRRERIPLGTSTPKMGAKVPDHLVGYWFNDDPGRIEAALNAGYTFFSDKGETDDRESGRSMRVGVNEDGSVKMAYLMVIQKEWYDEDQAAKQKPIDEFEAAINRGEPQGAEAQQEAGTFYDAGTSIRR